MLVVQGSCRRIVTVLFWVLTLFKTARVADSDQDQFRVMNNRVFSVWGGASFLSGVLFMRIAW